jgi:hypothetical protein
MKPFLSPLAWFRSSWPTIGLILIVAVVLLSVVLFIHVWKEIPIGNLTRDPTSIVGVPLYTGFLSQIGIFFWSASAAVCLFSVKVLSTQPDSLKFKHFLLVSALLTLLLGLDDVFLLHDEILPRFGIPEKIVYVSYVGLVLLYLVRFHTVILETEYILLVMAVFFFGVSVALDWFEPSALGQYMFLFEDGAKLVGLLSWLSYYFRVGAFAVQQGAAPDGRSAAPGC